MKLLKPLLFTMSVAFLFTSCQKEEVVEANDQNSENIETNIAFRNPPDRIIRAFTWHEKWSDLANDCIYAPDYHCGIASWNGNIEYFAIPPNPVDADRDNAYVDNTYIDGTNALIDISFNSNSVEIEILEYSEESMYEERTGVYTIPEDGYLKLGDTYAINETIKSVLLRAGEYEIVPSDNENSVGTVIIDAVIDFM